MHGQVPQGSAYQRWLGLETPTPTYYQLLGLAPGQTDPQRIHAAAQRRVHQLQQVQPAGEADQAQLKRLLYEVTRARQCLLDPQQRERYDRSLGAPALEPLDLSLCPDVPLGGAATQATLRPLGHNKPQQPSPWQRWLWPAVGSTAALAVFVGLMIYLMSGSGPATAYKPPPKPESADDASAPPPPAPPTVAEELPVEEVGEAAPLPLPVEVVATEPLEAVPPADALAELPGEFELPPRTVSQAGVPDDPAGHTIGALPTSAAALLTIRLEDAACNLEQRYHFTLEPYEITPGRGWAVWLRPRTPSDDAENSALAATLVQPTSPVAFFLAQYGRLAFRWNGENKHPLASQLRNGVLELSDGATARLLRLRKVERLPALVVDLAEDEHRLDWQLPDPPAAEQMYLEIVGLEGFPPELAQAMKGRRFAVGEEAKLVIHQEPVADISLKLEQAEDAWALLTVSRYYSGRRDLELDAEQVRTTILNLNKTLQENSRELANARNAADQIARRLRYLSSLPSPTGITRDAERLQRLQEAQALQAQLKKAGGTIRRYENSLPRTQAAFQQMTSLASTCESLHQKAKIRVRVVAATKAGDWDLFVADHR